MGDVMKVLEVFGEPIANGGQEAFVFNMIQYMDLSDMTVDVLTPYYCDNDYYVDVVESINGKVVSLGLPFEPGASRFNFIKPFHKYLSENAYDVVHVHSGSISILAEVAAVAKHNKVKKIIVHSHCAADHKTWKYRLIKLVSLPFMSLCPTDHCACSQVAGDWKFSKRIAKNHLIILKNGVDLQKFSYDEAVRAQYRKKLGIQEDTYVLGHVGRFSYQKNHEYLIDMFGKIKEQCLNSKLLLIGSGELWDDVTNQIASLGLTEDVILLGNVNNVSDYLQVMDTFVLPSRFEGLPIVGVEAQAAGLPVVVSTNVSEELKLTDQIHYLDLSDMSEWVKLVCELKNQPRKNSEKMLKEAGYDIQNTADYLVKLYHNQ